MNKTIITDSGIAVDIKTKGQFFTKRDFSTRSMVFITFGNVLCVTEPLSKIKSYFFFEIKD